MTTPQASVLHALRLYAVRYQESAHLLARWMELPTTDGTALGEIIWAERDSAPLTPAALSHRVGLTSGATTALINRLENRGFVSRSRESRDRRSVTLRATDAAHERIAPFLDRSTASLAEALEDYDDDTLSRVSDFLLRFAAVLPGASDAESAVDEKPTSPGRRRRTGTDVDPAG